MLDLEVIPERSLGCPEKSWEFILGEFNQFSLFLCFANKILKFNFVDFRDAFFASCCYNSVASGYHQECPGSVFRSGELKDFGIDEKLTLGSGSFSFDIQE